MMTFAKELARLHAEYPLYPDQWFNGNIRTNITLDLKTDPLLVKNQEIQAVTSFYEGYLEHYKNLPT